MTGSSYPPARTLAVTIEKYFAAHLAAAHEQQQEKLAPQPDAPTIEAIIDAAFWASLRQEEKYFPKISLALLPPEQAGQPLTFARPLPFTPVTLSRLAPAAERPEIHLGVWRFGTELFVWGTTRVIPRLCFVLEVVEPGLLVIKYRRNQDPSKFVNVAVLKGDEVKLVDEEDASLPDCPAVLTSLLGFGSPSDSVNILVQLAVSMRAHGRGGALLVVPQNSLTWRESILHPVLYSVTPPFSELSELMQQEAAERSRRSWQEALRRAVAAVAGLTAVDGAAVMNDQYQVLAFGAKIVRRSGATRVERIILTEPVIGAPASIIDPEQLGGTRHLSAAQFIQDQRDAVALVASQDGRFTIFVWSPCEELVHAHRVETLLL
jgi:hypothetical protein